MTLPAPTGRRQEAPVSQGYTLAHVAGRDRNHGRIERRRLEVERLAPAPAFEAASIKPSQDPPGSSSGITTTRGRISARNVTLKRCVRGAYGIEEPRILGGPKWLDEARYDIETRAAGPAGDRELMMMLQSLLAERFKLAFHRETRVLPGYALVVGKSGLKAKPSAPDAGSRTSSRWGSIEAAGCNRPRGEAIGELKRLRDVAWRPRLALGL